MPAGVEVTRVAPITPYLKQGMEWFCWEEVAMKVVCLVVVTAVGAGCFGS